MHRRQKPSKHGCVAAVAGRPRDTAFTLLEMMVTVALLAILVGAVVLTPRRWFRSTRLHDVVDRLVMLDRLARQQAVRSGRGVNLNFDLTKGTVTRVDPQQPKARSSGVRLPSAVTITRLITASQPPVVFGAAVIACSDRGHSPTYGVRLKGPDQLDQWVVIAGLTGQAVLVNHEKAVNELLQQLVP